MPRAFKPAARPRRLLTPFARNSAIVGARSAARVAACALMTAAALARVLAVGFTPRSPPSFLPRRLAAARAALVRALIIPASSSATATICCSRKRPVAPSICGRSAKRTSTPASSRRDRKATERVSRSTLETTREARWSRAAARVLSSSGRSERLPDILGLADRPAQAELAAPMRALVAAVVHLHRRTLLRHRRFMPKMAPPACRARFCKRATTTRRVSSQSNRLAV